ncbi:Alpha/beta hydrolase fold-3 [Laetiporus sulphureus 93-53]|uniref:Alpha/beta hydrolase fold-3 n=1 Tax=Laetiporus sulphureus 93-53 TaxID=1314785 RepID=A0A165CEC6_9APHY|nr:Alpha/beta hydrolase fold-3 [Laetiporus sulphureus 93-53]KZT02660.1 Alpha/beta hydrolase fold-3 [Laetiporus sulphureus 93-53]
MRVFTPEGSAPLSGWPVLLYFHGGGWTLGNIDTESAFCTNMCKRANCIVISVDYRLGPEDPYPAAVEDAEEALYWVARNGKEQLNVDPNKLAVGGSSSGGNLAAVVALKAAAAEPPIPLVLQFLSVPAVDNTATTSGEPYKSWSENANTVQLSPGRMLWFRDNYLPNEKDRLAWDASPIFAPEELVKKVTKAWIAVMELDILRDEGIAYAEKLKKAGVEGEVKMYKGAPHPILAMDGVLTIARTFFSDAVQVLTEAFKTN